MTAMAMVYQIVILSLRHVSVAAVTNAKPEPIQAVVVGTMVLVHIPKAPVSILVVAVMCSHVPGAPGVLALPLVVAVPKPGMTTVATFRHKLVTPNLAKRARPPPLSPAPSIVMAAPVSVGKGETVSGNRHHLKLGAAQTRV